VPTLTWGLLRSNFSFAILPTSRVVWSNSGAD